MGARGQNIYVSGILLEGDIGEINHNYKLLFRALHHRSRQETIAHKIGLKIVKLLHLFPWNIEYAIVRGQGFFSHEFR